MFTQHLSHLSASQTTLLFAVAPGLLMLLAGYRFHHAMDVAAAKAWGR